MARVTSLQAAETPIPGVSCYLRSCHAMPLSQFIWLLCDCFRLAYARVWLSALGLDPKDFFFVCCQML